MSTALERLFEKIDFLKKEAGLDDKDLADKLGIARASYSRMKSGNRRIPLYLLKQIADIFEVPLFYFLLIEPDISDLEIDIKIQRYVEDHSLTYSKLSNKLEINALRLLELAQGYNPTSEELRKINTTLDLDLPESKVTDNRLLLMEKILRKLDVEETKVHDIIEYMERN